MKTNSASCCKIPLHKISVNNRPLAKKRKLFWEPPPASPVAALAPVSLAVTNILT